MKLPKILVVFLLLALGLPAQAASRQEIDVYVDEALREFRQHTSAGATLASRASGMLGLAVDGLSGAHVGQGDTAIDAHFPALAGAKFIQGRVGHKQNDLGFTLSARLQTNGSRCGTDSANKQ